MLGLLAVIAVSSREYIKSLLCGMDHAEPDPAGSDTQTAVLTLKSNEID